ADETEVLGTASLSGEEAHAHVDAATARRELADDVAADERAHRRAEIGDGDAELRRATAIGHDLKLLRPDLIVAVQIGDEAARLEVLLHLVRRLDERVPVRAAHGEVDGRASAAHAEPLLRRI